MTQSSTSEIPAAVNQRSDLAVGYDDALRVVDLVVESVQGGVDIGKRVGVGDGVAEVESADADQLKHGVDGVACEAIGAEQL